MMIFPQLLLSLTLPHFACIIHCIAAPASSSSSNWLYATPVLVGSHVDAFKRYKRVGGTDEDNDNNDEDNDEDKKNNYDKDKKLGTGSGKGGGKGKGKSGFTVQECLDKFVECEQMAAEETFYCGYVEYRPTIPLFMPSQPDLAIISL